MKRIQRGPVRGISFKLQEEERERKDQYVPDVSALDVPVIDVDPDTHDLLKSLGMDHMEKLNVGARVLNANAGAGERRPPRVGGGGRRND